MKLEVKNLIVYFYKGREILKAVDDVSFAIDKGEVLGLIGESGCGKSITGFTVMGFEKDRPGIISGEIWYNGENLLSELNKICYPDLNLENTTDSQLVSGKMRHWREWAKHYKNRIKSIRGKQISMLFQDPEQYLDPLFSIGKHIKEAMKLRQNNMSKTPEKWLEDVGIPDPKKCLKQYPHQLSMGMKQRVITAMALIPEPSLLIADEPTTSLDATIGLKIVRLLKEKFSKKQIPSMLVISHNINVIKALATKVAVMYAGRIVEMGSCDIFDNSQKHPYTEGLLGSIITDAHIQNRLPLTELKQEVPSLTNLPTGCKFHPRCDKNDRLAELCEKEEPPLSEIDRQSGHKIRCWLYE